MLKAPKRIRGTYGKTWERLMDGMELDRKWLDKIGKILVEEIVQQARIDSAKARGLKAGNMIPRDPKFFQSFSHNIRGRSTIEIISTWPGITDLTEGRGPFPMEWLRRKVGEAKVIPLAVPGSPVPIFRSAPLQTESAWIHPGIARHTFIRRGIKRARKRVVAVYAEALQHA